MALSGKQFEFLIKAKDKFNRLKAATTGSKAYLKGVEALKAAKPKLEAMNTLRNRRLLTGTTTGGATAVIQYGKDRKQGRSVGSSLARGAGMGALAGGLTGYGWKEIEPMAERLGTRVGTLAAPGVAAARRQFGAARNRFRNYRAARAAKNIAST